MKKKVPRKSANSSDKSADEGRPETGGPKDSVDRLAESLDNAVNANDRLAALYHEFAMKAKDPKHRAAFLELEQRVRRDQAELIQAIESFGRPPDEEKQRE